MGEGPAWTDEEDFGTDVDPIARDAANWFATMQTGSVTGEQRVAFRAWLRRDTRHKPAYSAIERIWSGAAELPVARERRKASRLDLTRRGLGKAAIAAAIGGGGWLAWRQHPFADYRTGTGERRMVTFADSSRVELAADTALSAEFGQQSRLVTLHRGEAFFSVAPDIDRPFILTAGEGQSTTTSASFNVDYLSDDDVRITATERDVNVKVHTSEAQLGAGAQLTYGRAGIGEPEPVDAATELSWREGRLVFLSQPLGRVTASLNRWRPDDLIVVSPALARRPVTLIVDLEKSGDILPVLEKTLPIRVVRLGSYLTLIFEA